MAWKYGAMAKAAVKAAIDEESDPETDETVEAVTAPGSRMPGKKIILYFVAPALALLIAAGAGAYFFGLLTSDESEVTAENGKDAHGQDAAMPEVAFFDLPEILINLNSSGKKEAYLKIRISLELDSKEATAALEPLIPRVIDNFQVFLREMRPEDLSGSAGMIRLKEELMHRVNLSLKPVVVKDILFKEILVQ